jgi:pyruvate dehydrogenase E1 component
MSAEGGIDKQNKRILVSKAAEKKDLNFEVLDKVARRAHYLANRMIYIANNRDNVQKGDPKIGGHSSASASALHILGTLHLVMKTGFDYLCNKPHASPADHAYNYLMNLLLHPDFTRFSWEESNIAMNGLRAFPTEGQPVFQSYHSAYDPDFHNMAPSGTVGIPPVNVGYMALAYRYAERHGYNVPKAHFWCLMGDSEFREGSLHEAVPDFAERELGNLTWIVDYNRQSLDGHRMTNIGAMHGTDDQRIQRTMEANGWHVVQVRHGQKRLALFKKKGGDVFQKLLEGGLQDYEIQVLLLIKDPKEVRQYLKSKDKNIETFLKDISDDDLMFAVRDLGGHDFQSLMEAFEETKAETKRPSMVIAHTIKGWGLEMAATPGNHSALPEEAELEALAKRANLPAKTPFAPFDENSPEGKFCKQRGDQLYKDILAQEDLKQKNIEQFKKTAATLGPIPDSLEINLKMANYPHTQWMLGQLTAKLTRIANTPLDSKKLKEKQKPLLENERPFHQIAEMMVSMAPDVGTSTNLNPSMDGKIYGHAVEDFETEYGVKDAKMPDLIQGEDVSDRFLRFEIAEGNVMSCMGSFGKIRDTLGIPLMPLMTVYDFFVKRAHDQFFYNLYWKSSFIAVGTPSGVTLSPEGAQHGWKSDFQIPNQITWEPFFCQELDWILVESLRRHVGFDNEGRTGVHIRGVTRGIDQKTFLQNLKRQRRFKEGTPDHLVHPSYTLEGGIDEVTVASISDEQIMSQLREDVLNGAYYLIDYRGYQGYEPGDNVVNIFSMGSPTTEAIKASDALLAKGIYANVIVVTSTDLLLGNLGRADGYKYLKEGLGINSNLYIQPVLNGHLGGTELKTIAGRRIPIVSVHDGEPGLMDNIGSLIGVRHEALAVYKHSRCGRPDDIYKYHHIDSEAVIEACGQVLAETALETIQVSNRTLDEAKSSRAEGNWEELWPHAGK